MSEVGAMIRADVQYGRVPAWLFDARRRRLRRDGTVVEGGVSASAIRLFAYLDTFTRGHDECFPMRRTIAEGLGCSLRAVAEALAELVEVGAVTITRRRGSSLYVLHISGPGTVESADATAGRDRQNSAHLNSDEPELATPRQADFRTSDRQNSAHQIGRIPHILKEKNLKEKNLKDPGGSVSNVSNDARAVQNESPPMSPPDSTQDEPEGSVEALAAGLQSIENGVPVGSSSEVPVVTDREPDPGPDPKGGPAPDRHQATLLARIRGHQHAEQPSTSTTEHRQRVCVECGRPIPAGGVRHEACYRRRVDAINAGIPHDQPLTPSETTP